MTSEYLKMNGQNLNWARQGRQNASQSNRRFRRSRTKIPTLKSTPRGTPRGTPKTDEDVSIVTAGGGDVTAQELAAIRQLEQQKPTPHSNNDNNNDNIGHELSIPNRK